MKFNLTIQQLKASEKSVYSQGGQDGVLQAIFNQIGCGNKRFVEFGARDGMECSNTAYLRIRFGWNGILMDAEPLSYWVRKEVINVSNINYLFEYYCIRDIELASIDTDGNEYWLWQELKSTPKVVCIEYNSKFKNTECYTIEYNPDHKWEGDDYYGASLLALKKLGEQKGYTLIYVVDRFDAIFIRNDLISPDYVVPTLDELLPEPIIAFDKVSDKKWVELPIYLVNNDY